jgi:putative phosphonate catabolism associated alcohol dehydrogenase
VDAQIAVLDDGKITVTDVSLGDRSPGEVDVAMTLAAICGSDVHTVLGHRSTPARTALGHEGVGRIIDVDGGATDMVGAALAPGDRVVFALFRACGRCDRCTQGLAMKCRTLLKYGHESVDTPPHATGSLATAVRLLPGVPVMRIPEGISDTDVVSAGCAVATAAAIVHAAGFPSEGTRILVYGAGAVGAFTIAMLASRGCSVVVSEPSTMRRELSVGLGARPDFSTSDSFPVVVEASGHSTVLAAALGRTDIGGVIIAAGSVSLGDSATTFDPAMLVTRRLTMTGVHNYTPAEFRWGVEWLLANAERLDFQPMMSQPAPLSAVDAAFEEMHSGKYLRVLVRPDHSRQSGHSQLGIASHVARRDDFHMTDDFKVAE